MIWKLSQERVGDENGKYGGAAGQQHQSLRNTSMKFGAELRDLTSEWNDFWFNIIFKWSKS
jgi:hypothetical protein